MRKANYRSERDRMKQAKKGEKARRQQERVSQQAPEEADQAAPPNDREEST